MVAARRTNLALLVLLPVALASGGMAFGIGASGTRWAAMLHGAAGLAVALLTPWKSVIVRRGLRRRRRGTWASIVFAVLVVTALVTGVLHATGLAVDLGPVTAMQVHVSAALLALPLLAVHVSARPERPRPGDLSRRTLLRSGTLVGGSAVVYGTLEGVVRVASLPGADRRATGSYERGAFQPAAMPVTQWLDDDVPAVDVSEWRLVVVGEGGEERHWRYDELAGFDDRVRATLDCTGGWWAVQDWEGVRLSRLLPPGSGRSVVVRSRTGYARRLPVSDARHLLVATRVGGAPLSAGHGYPARLVAPGRRGFWWVKWIDRIEVSDRPWWLQSPFPLT